MNGRRGPHGRLNPGIALALLESLRAHDTPAEVLEDEAFHRSLPRRFGLSEVVDGQMRRYAELSERRQLLDAGEFRDLVRLVCRRPDAREVFSETGRRLALEYLGRRSRTTRRMLRWLPRGLRRPLLARCMRRVGRAFNPASAVQSAGDPPTLTIERGLLASADDSGVACELITAALDACAEILWSPASVVTHTPCAAGGATVCVWTAEDHPGRSSGA